MEVADSKALPRRSWRRLHGWVPGPCRYPANSSSSSAKGRSWRRLHGGCRQRSFAEEELEAAPWMGTRTLPLPCQFGLLLGKDREQWPPEARFIEAAHHGDVRDIKKIAKELDVHGHGIPVTVANTTYMGMNALHTASGRGRLAAYQYLVEEVKMDINKPDTSQDYSSVEHAVTYGNLPAVRYLLDHAADLHHKRSGNVTLLHSAAIHAIQPST